jgi:hypothetical protein
MEVLADDELAFHSKLRVCPKRYLFNQNQPTVLLVQLSGTGAVWFMEPPSLCVTLRLPLRTLRFLLMGFTAEDAKNSQRTAK